MEARAPAVVAAVVAKDPGDWFDETLRSLGAQDYEELSVLVLVPEGSADPSTRVAETLPDAFVRSVSGSHFSAAIDEVLGTVQGAAFFLLCHDDVALDPDATRLLVEESFRSNAAVVSPKMTDWDDPRVLVHVGVGVDKTGAPVDRLQEAEVDHGQHDNVRDIFVAPGGCVLVRADLFREIGGFDPTIEAMGEDLDLCWRAQVAGARIVVAPQARVRHLENLVHGRRALPADPSGSAAAPLTRLQRRYELHTVLVCYSLFHLLRVLPQAMVLSVGEAVGALLSGDTHHAGDVASAWTWNLRRLGQLRKRRKEVGRVRQRKDAEIRRIQSPGSVRLSTYMTQVAHLGLVVARGTREAPEVQRPGQPELTGSVGGAFSEDASFDDIEDASRTRRPPALSTQRSRILVWLAVAVLVAVGSRQIFSHGLPVVGQLLPLPSWTGTWHRLFAAWQPAGVGTTAPSTPAFAVVGLVGTVLFGSMGLAQTVLVLGCIPVGAWGLVRLLRPLCSPRARLVGGLAYLGVPLVYNALAQGRWDAMVAFALTPWLVARLARASGHGPFEAPRGWRGTLWGQAVTLGILEAVAVSFAPAVAVVVLLAGLAIPAGSLLAGRPGGLRAAAVAIGGTVAAAVLCAPWVIGILASGHQAFGVLGLPLSGSGSWSWSTLMRFGVGPTGGSPLSWLLIAVAFLPLLVSRQARLSWAIRLWMLAVAGWVLAWLVGRGWTGSFAPQIDVLLAAPACGVAASIGIGFSSFEAELSEHQFGWRQLASAVAVVAAAVGLLPVLVQVGDGAWGLPQTGINQPLAWLSAQGAGGSRVLWLADPRVLPGGGWSVQHGLAYTTSEGGPMHSANLWAPAGPGPASRLADAVRLAETGRTATLGQLLAPAGVRYVVLLNTLAPSAPGVQRSTAFRPPPQALAGLLHQGDLRVVPGGEGYVVFANRDFVPQRAQRAASLGPVATGDSWPRRSDLRGWRGVLGGPTGGTAFSGSVSKGPLVSAAAPAGSWHLVVKGRPVTQEPAYGWAAQFLRVGGGQATLQLDAGPLVPLGVSLEVVLWLALMAVLVLTRRSGSPAADPARVARRGRRGRRAPSHGAPASTVGRAGRRRSLGVGRHQRAPAPSHDDGDQVGAAAPGHREEAGT